MTPILPAPEPADPPTEVEVPPWQHLVRRPASWRKQLYVKGRKLTVRALVGAMHSNGLTAEETAADYGIPVEAVREALAYYDQNKAVIDAEVADERRRAEEKGYRLEPPPLPG